MEDSSDEEILQQGRNFIFKTTDDSGNPVTIKSFKKPNIANQFIYGKLRKSKARRSYEHAKKLQELGIGTPEPIAYVENFKNGALQDSYYISAYQRYDLTYRELVEIPDLQNHELILRRFTDFSYDLHEKGVLFKDHSPGNTLIRKNEDGDYDFYLVDLNRMNFKNDLDFEERMHNLRRLTPKKEMVKIMANQYAQLSGEPCDMIFSELWKQTENFQKAYRRKRNWKQKMKKK